MLLDTTPFERIIGFIFPPVEDIIDALPIVLFAKFVAPIMDGAIDALKFVPILGTGILPYCCSGGTIPVTVADYNAGCVARANI